MTTKTWVTQGNFHLHASKYKVHKLTSITLKEETKKLQKL